MYLYHFEIMIRVPRDSYALFILHSTSINKIT